MKVSAIPDSAVHCVVAFHCSLTNEQNEVIDSSEGRDPLVYVQGAGTIIPGLEKAMVGHEAGDKFTVTVDPVDAYGVRHPELIQEVPRTAFLGVEDIQPGMQFQGRNDQGTINVTVTKVDDANVTVDGNHPLAGQALTFAVEVVSVREATEDEWNTGRAE